MRFTNIYRWLPGDRVMYVGPSLDKIITRGRVGVVERVSKYLEHTVKVKFDDGRWLFLTQRNLRNLTEEEGRK